MKYVYIVIYLIDILTEIVNGGCLVKTQYKEDSCTNWDSQQINIFLWFICIYSIFQNPRCKLSDFCWIVNKRCLKCY
jgi:hypothetical protein